MQTIEIDFAVWQALTASRRSEAHSYNDVLRELLKLGDVSGSEQPTTERASADNGSGRYLGGRWLPDGTLLKAKYKGQLHKAEIRDGQLVSESGVHNSASAAAKAVTSTSVNGLTFWSVKRPSDAGWHSLLFIEKTR